MLTPREQLAELDALIAAHKANIAHVRNMLNNPDLATRLINERRATIDKLLSEIAELSSVQIYGDSIMDRSRDRIAELKTKRIALANSEAIQKLLELQEKINEIADSEDGLDIAALVAEIETEMDGEDSEND